MTVEFKTQELKDDCTLQDVKDFSADVCNELAEGFNGYSMPTVAIACSHFLDAVFNHLEDQTVQRLQGHIDGLPAKETVEVLEIVKDIMKGDGNLPSMKETGESVGSVLGYMSILKLICTVRRYLHEAKVALAGTVLSFDQRADDMAELSKLMDLDISDEEKHWIRNRLKGGTSDPVDVKSGKDLNDLCDDLFG